MQLKKIEFADKLQSLLVSSQYTITSLEANEIKHTVNNIIDEMYASKVDNKIAFKYVRLDAPDSEWDSLTMEMSQTPGFSEPSALVLSATIDGYVNQDPRFKTFISGGFENITNVNALTGDILVDISDHVLNDEGEAGAMIPKVTYCRYFFKKGEDQIGDTGVFNLLINDYQKTNREVGQPIILFSESEKDIARSYDELQCKWLNCVCDEFDENPVASAFIKFDDISDSLIDAAGSNYVSGGLVKASNVEFSNNLVQNGQKLMVDVSASFSFNGEDYNVSRKFVKTNDMPIGLFLQQLSMKLGDNRFSLSGTNKFEKDVVSEANAYAENVALAFDDPNAEVVRNDTIRVSGINSTKSSSNAISINGNEIPISIDRSEIVSIEIDGLDDSVNTDNGVRINFTVYGVSYDGTKKTITNDVSLIVMALDTSYIAFTPGVATIDRDVEEGSHVVMFKYGDVVFYKKIECVKTNKDTSIRIENLSSCIKAGESLTGISVICASGNTEFDVTREAEFGSSTTLIVDPISKTITAEDINQSRTEQLNVEYNGDIITKFIKVKANEPTLLEAKIFNHGTDIEADYVLSADAEYDLKATVEYNDGTRKDVTLSATFSIPETFNDKIIKNVLTTAEERAMRNLVIDVSYYDPMSDRLLETQATAFVFGFAFSSIELIGETEIYPGRTYEYITNAMYNNGTSKRVSATYKATDLISSTISSYNSESMILSIEPKKTLVDKSFTLSSTYMEPGFEEFEHDTVSKDILIKGGFFATLTGNLVVSYNGSTANEIYFSSNEQLISAVTPNDFYRPATTTQRLQASLTTIDTNFILQLNLDSDKYDFIKVTNHDTGEEVAVAPINFQNLADPPSVRSGVYDFTLFNLVSSIDCESNSYEDAKAIQECRIRPVQTMQNIYVSSLISGDPNRYYECSIYEDGLAERVAYGLIESLKWTFRSGVIYTLKFKPISKKNDSINTYFNFDINKDLTLSLTNPFEISFNNLSLGHGLQILDVYGIFKVENNKTIVRRFAYAPSFDEIGSWKWIAVDMPVRVKTLSKIKIAFAFKED